MYSINLNLEKDLTNSLVKRIQALEGHKVEIGMFASQGQHSSGYSYVGLFKYLSTGDPNNGG